jgi:hypothetical protein
MKPLEFPRLFTLMLVVSICAFVSNPTAAHAAAQTAVYRNVSAGPIYYRFYEIKANRSVTIQTSGLAPVGADSVIHVQDYLTGVFVGGDDDSAGGFASKVVLSTSPLVRGIWIYVRSFSATTGGSATLTVNDGVSLETFNITFSGQNVAGGPSDGTAYLPGSRFTTVERGLNGVDDSVILVVNKNNISEAVDSDNQSGVGGMAMIEFTSGQPQCVQSGGCFLVVGHSGIDFLGARGLDVVVDGDWSLGGNDAGDNDNLSAQLEAVLGTNPNSADSDADGLKDGVEVYGAMEVPGGKPVKFPLMGADPLKKDIFFEFDWLIGCATCQFDHVVAEQVRLKYLPEFVVHFDTGRVNTDPVSATYYNDWGGARQEVQIFKEERNCKALSPERVGYFHHYAGDSDLENAASSDLPGRCAGGTLKPALAIVHEFGHQFGLSHGGSKASGSFNLRPHYRSIMNYLGDAGSGQPGDLRFLDYSRGDYAGLALNNAGLNETINHNVFPGLRPRSKTS